MGWLVQNQDLQQESWQERPDGPPRRELEPRLPNPPPSEPTFGDFQAVDILVGANCVVEGILVVKIILTEGTQLSQSNACGKTTKPKWDLDIRPERST